MHPLRGTADPQYALHLLYYRSASTSKTRSFATCSTRASIRLHARRIGARTRSSDTQSERIANFTVQRTYSQSWIKPDLGTAQKACAIAELQRSRTAFSASYGRSDHKRSTMSQEHGEHQRRDAAAEARVDRQPRPGVGRAASSTPSVPSGSERDHPVRADRSPPKCRYWRRAPAAGLPRSRARAPAGNAGTGPELMPNQPSLVRLSSQPGRSPRGHRLARETRSRSRSAAGTRGARGTAIGAVRDRPE